MIITVYIFLCVGFVLLLLLSLSEADIYRDENES